MTLGNELPHSHLHPSSEPAVGMQVVAHVRDYGRFPGTITMLCRTGVTIRGPGAQQLGFFPWANIICLDLEPDS